MKVVLSDDTENGLTLLATEGTSTPVETDPTFSSRLIAADTTTGGLVKVSFEELEDSYFNLDTFIRSKFSIRYARGIETAITTGKDASGAVLPNLPDSLLSTATVGTTTTTLINGIGWDDITAMLGALDAAYQVNASWVMSPGIRSFLLAAKDGFGRPFWTPDPSADAPFAKLLGFDVVLNAALPSTLVAGGTPILFGNLERSYLLRTVGEPTVLRLSERYADQLMIGFYLYSRQAGCSLAVPGAPSPLVSLKLATS
jgi:HK97 family phage major capsid protein